MERRGITHSSAVADNAPAWRLPAHDIEKVVIERLVGFLEDRASIRRIIESDDARKLSNALTSCQQTAERLRSSTFHRRTRIPVLVERVNVGDAAIRIALSLSGLSDVLGADIDDDRLSTLTAPVCRIRKGNEVKLVITHGARVERDQAIVSLLREAMAVRDEVLAATSQTIAEIAASTGRCRKRLGRLLRLSWLAPDLVDAILEARQPATLTAKALLEARLPVAWRDQKIELGFN